MVSPQSDGIGLINNQRLSNIMNVELVSQRPLISYHNLQKASKGIKILLSEYFPIYKLSADDLCSYYPAINFITALVYQTDVEVESAQLDGSYFSRQDPWTSKQETILSLLREIHIEHPKIQEYLEEMGEYFRLESKLMLSEKITHTDLIRANELRSADIRTVHCTLLQLLGLPYKQEVFDLHFPREVICEIGEDILEYQDDVKTKHFNTYKMFERLYGTEAPHYLKAEIERYQNLFQESLKQFSPDEQKIHWDIWDNCWKEFSFLVSPEKLSSYVAA